MDIRLDTLSEEQIAANTQLVLGELKAAGFKVREVSDTPNAIERKIGNDWIKIAEYHGAQPTIEGEVVPESVLGFKKVGKPITIQENLATPLSEELRGVMQGVARIRKTPEGGLDIFPSPKRMKDIGSVSVSARTLAQSKLFGGDILTGRIERFEGLFPNELVREQVKIAVTEPTEVKLADFSQQNYNPLSSVKASPDAIYSQPTYLVSSSSPSKTIEFSSVSVSASPKSVSPSLSPSISSSPSASVSPSLSLSPSISITKSPSTSISPKSISPSPSISISPSPSSSISPSPSVSPSPSSSISPSTSNSISSYLFVKEKKKSVSKRKAYNVLIKRRGKFFEIAKGLPQGQAFKVGAEKTIRTLARTFSLKEAGTTELEDISYFPSNKTFRAPKRPVSNDLTFVQRVGLTRGTGEVPEIQYYKRMKPKKNIFAKTKKSRRFNLFK